MTLERAVEIIRETSRRLQRSRKIRFNDEERGLLLQACDTTVRAGRSCKGLEIDLLRVSAAFDPNVKQNPARGIVKVVLRKRIDAGVLRLADQPSTRKWFRELARELVRRERLDEAHAVYRAVSDHNEGRPVHAKDELSFVLSKHGAAGLIAAIFEGRADGLQHRDVLQLVAELGRDVDGIAVGAERLSNHIAMILFLRPSIQESRVLDEKLIELWRDRGPGQLLITMLVAFHGAAAPDLNDRGELILRGDRVLPGLGYWVNQILTAASDTSLTQIDWREDAEIVANEPGFPESHRRDLRRALRWISERDAVLKGAIPLAEFCGDGPPVGRFDIRPDLLISLGMISPSTRRDFGAVWSDVPELRHGAVADEEIDRTDLQTARDFEPTYNSEEGRGAVAEARHLSLAIAPICIEAASESWAERLRDEVFALALEDRIYGSLKRKQGVVRGVDLLDARRITIVARPQQVCQAIEIGLELTSLGRDVFIAIEAFPLSGMLAILKPWAGRVKSPEDFLIRFTTEKFSAARPRKIRLAPPMSPSQRGSGVLLATSLSDASYLKSAVSIAEGLDKLGSTVRLFNGGTAGDVQFAELTGRKFDILRDDRRHIDSERDDVRSSISALLKSLETDRSDLPRYLFYCLTAVINACVRGVMQEFSYYNIINHEISASSPSVIVTLPGRMVAARMITIIAQAANIETIDLQAIYISSHPRYYPSLADHYLAISTDQRDVYLSKPRLKEQDISVVGSLMISREVANSLGIDRETARSSFPIARNGFLTVYAAQYAQGAEGLAVLEAIVLASRIISNHTLVVKVHPKTSPDDVRKIERVVSNSNSEDRIVVAREGNLYHMMRGADLVLTQFSNVGLEAAVLGLPVLSVNLTGEDYIVDPYRIGLAERAASLDEIAEKMHDLLESPEARNRLAAKQDAYFRENPMLRRVDVARCIAEFVVSRGHRDPARRLNFDEIVRRVDANPLPLPSAETVALRRSGSTLVRGWAWINMQLTERFWAGRGVAVRGARHFWHMLPSQIRVRLIPTAIKTRAYFGRRPET